MLTRGISSALRRLLPRRRDAVPSTPVLTERQLERAISILTNDAHDIRRFSGPFWVAVPPVRCKDGVSGTFHLRGRKNALVVNRRVCVCEFDGDLFSATSVCVVLDGEAAIEVEVTASGVTVALLDADVPLLASVTRANAMPLDSTADLEALPPAIGKVMRDVLARIHEVQAWRDAQPTVADRLLSY